MEKQEERTKKRKKEENKIVKRCSQQGAWLWYLCIVGDIEAQTDQAGFKLFGAQRAGVVLGWVWQASVRWGVGGATGHAGVSVQ